ncbi:MULTISPECIES: nucleotide disphospho-sugar-binding domain-containing protein [Shouchella]|nr:MULTISPECIES: nucleotide disphospho-sugar-binding domain-containing protein [Shouchella]MCM3380811.1 hypothetical protein [Shouchella rhizosphaerae]
MNSTSEGLYFGVPLILFPQHGEQRMVADRVAELGAGFKLNSNKPKHLAAAVAEVLVNPTYKKEAQKLAKSFREAGGAAKAASVILSKIS